MVAAARRTLPQAEAEQAPLLDATAQPAPYAGASFLVAAPDPRALLIPVLLLKARGRGARPRVRAPDDERARCRRLRQHELRASRETSRRASELPRMQRSVNVQQSMRGEGCRSPLLFYVMLLCM
ncbi:hypothetical protein GQ55_2G255900 [Panicum hallii var. hallii]|uniref:Uncharacterized protein n=1 Tax=Panicum hallii var. hallii TaxID=1504633 RepID=A0A2T7ES92_9POAL|nr:hypothetical protein GQ55_2G255900 [Panicum hallii var. hallii]